MALSMILLIPCGLFVRSWLNASFVSPGFATDRVLLLPISTNQAGVRIQKPEGFDWQLPALISTLPGVEAATVMDPVPLWFGDRNADFAPDDSGSGDSHRIGHASITPGYFATLKIPLLAGRDFTDSDTASAPTVAIVNETLARRFWPEGGVVGRRLRHRASTIEVVGVAKDSKYVSLADASRPFVYRPQTQSPGNNLALSLAVRTTGDPLAVAPVIEREVRALAPGWPVFQFRTLDEALALQRLVPRLGATLLGALGAFGLLLAAVGLYGVMAYVVRQRTHEIGIRLALGAPLASVLALVIRQGMAVCLSGAGVGLAVALAVSQLLASLLYGISAIDPVTYVAVPAVLMGVALFACYLPARRITQLQALQALREE
jgi:predicted permease